MKRYLSVICLLVIVVAVSSGSARADEEWYHSIRVVDSGPFQIMNGVDGDSTDPDARVLVVQGAEVGIVIHYSSSIVAPSVDFLPGFVEIDSGTGVAFTNLDIAEGQILTCTNQGTPGGAIVCYCGLCEGSCECDSADTGIWPASATVNDIVTLSAN